jgi:hypothetical protein
MLTSDECRQAVDTNAELTPGRRAFVQKAIDSGRIAREEE